MKTGYAMIEKEGKATYYSGEIFELSGLDEIQKIRERSRYPLIFVNPFRTIRERGFGFKAKGNEPVLVLEASTSEIFKRKNFLAMIEGEIRGVEVESEREIMPSVSDEEFAGQVQQIQNKEIAGGNASQVVLSRKFCGQIKNMSPVIYLALYKRLLERRGQYMTFLFNNNDEYAFIGVSPECHLRIQGQKITMNPIAGTLKKIAFSNPKEELENFLQDSKEINELFQVLDEELKMMAKICPRGGKIVGPKLCETNTVIHTEYEFVGMGNNNTNAIAVLRETLHAPTLMGSPIESASRIIDRYEQDSREYYGGQYGVYKSNGDLDSAIFIRTAKLLISGEFIVQAGAGIVEDSIPLKEAEETTAKANSFLNIFKNENVIDEKSYLANVNSKWLKNLLGKRNAHLSSFHLEKQAECKRVAKLNGVKVIIINNEDNFAFMLAHMADHMGCQVEVIDTFLFDPDKINGDIVILGPGPGDINDINNQRMLKLLSDTRQLLDIQIPVLGICLGHQVLAVTLGMKVIKFEPMQGVQVKMNLFGKQEYLGFYNSFFVKSKNLPFGLKASVDEKDRIIAMRSKKFIGLQFHPESIMTQNGFEILKESLKSLAYNKNRR